MGSEVENRFAAGMAEGVLVLRKGLDVSLLPVIGVAVSFRFGGFAMDEYRNHSDCGLPG